MNRVPVIALALFALVACGSDATDATGPYHCPVGYMVAPMNMCVVNQSAPPCDCFEYGARCCRGDVCRNTSVCAAEVWTCKEGERLMDRCDREAIPAMREE